MSLKESELAPHFPISAEEYTAPTQEEFYADLARSVGHFVPDPYRRLGDQDSGHGVLFGHLEPGYGEVTIKPFTRSGKAQHEADMMRHVGNRGFPTLETLAVATEGEYEYLITRYRPGLRNLGQLPWRSNIASPHLKRTLIPSLNFAAEYAGRLEASSTVHGDLQAKNVVIDEDENAVAVDLESTVVNVPANELPTKSDKDLRKLGLSILRRGFLVDRTVGYRTRLLGRELIEPALEVAGVSTDESVERRKSLERELAVLFVQDRHPSGILRSRRRVA